MSRRMSQPIESLEQRVMMSISAGALSSVDDVALNPVGIHRGAPDSANEPGNVSGFVWLDENADGKIDSNEGGLFNQTLFLDLNNDGIPQHNDPFAVTNPNGYYVFKDVEPGSYVLRHARWDKLQASKPSSERYRVVVTEDAAITDRNFGVFLPRPVVIDYLVAYTREARRGAGGTDAIDAEISDMIAASNATFVNSEINLQLNLVSTEEVIYNESEDGRLDLDRLRAKGEGFIREIHTMRNELGADMATLIGESLGGNSQGILLGIAHFPDLEAGDPTSFGFNVVRRELATTEMVFTHELGHNLGAGHFHDDGGKFPYAHGHYITVGNRSYHSIMAYPRAEDERVLPFFSNPSLSYKGQPLGTANFSNNARTIRFYDNIVAGYRNRDQAGETRSQAYRFEPFTSERVEVIRDAVGNTDPVDVFRLDVEQPIHLTSRLFNLQRNAELQLLEGSRVVESSRRTGTNNERIERNLLPGTYYLRVYASSGSLGTTYTLKVVAEQVPDFIAAPAVAAASLFQNDAGDDEDLSLLDELFA